MSETSLTAEQLYEEANELMLNDEYEQALKIYSSAIEKCDKSKQNLLYTYYIGRSQAQLKLKNNQEALNDAELALNLNQTDSRAYLKKALYNLKDYQKALDSLLQGQSKAEKETEAKRNLFNEWINKCKKELPEQPPETKVEKTDEKLIAEAKKELEEKQKQLQAQPQLPPPIKYEWYQTESQVIVSVLAKNVPQNVLNVNTEKNSLHIESRDQENIKINFHFNLSYPVVPEQTQVKYLSTKVEIKMKKTEALHWSKLEASPNDVQVKTAAKIETEQKPYYPTSSKNPKNWDKLAAEVEQEEKDEKLEGDGALNRLFKQIYQNGSDEVRKAMNKSFSESGGTVLSTNWNEIGTKKVDVNPPDGLEWKKWE